MSIKLLCIPYAGGSAYAYKFLEKHLSNFEIIPIELKGRGKRFKEEHYNSFQEAIDDIYDSIKDVIKDSRYAIFGHSMGSWMAYELYYKILNKGNTLPIHLFFSGREAPCIEKKDSLIYKEKDEVIIETLKKLGGMEEEILNNDELLQLFLPIIKNDFKILSDYKFKEREEKIKINSTIISGNGDKTIDYKGFRKWTSLIEAQVSLVMLEGNHFYFNANPEVLSNIISQIGNEG